MIKKILCLITVVALILSSVSVFASVAPTNLALNKTVTVNGASDSIAVLTDGNISATSGTQSYSSRTSGDYYIIDLTNQVAFDTVKIYEYTYQRLAGYKIEVSSDNSAWETVAESSQNGTFTEATDNKKRFVGTISFESKTAKYIKITLTNSSTNFYYIQEFEVYNSKEENTDTPEEAVVVNLASKKNVEVSGGTYVDGVLTDGNISVNAMSGTWYSASANKYLILDLEETKTFNNVVLYEYSNQRMTGYKIEVSDDKNEWTTVIDSSTIQIFTVATDNAKRFKASFVFDEKNARYVKLTVKTSTSTFYLQEIEVYNDPDAVATIPDDNANEGDTPVVEDPQNFAKGKSVTISNPSDEGNPSLVTDGITATGSRNNTWWATKGSSIVVDLLNDKTFDCIVIYEYQNMRAKKYSVEVSSDNQVWTTVVPETEDWLAAAGGVISNGHYFAKLEIDKTTARYVKFTVNDLLDSVTNESVSYTYIEEIAIYDKTNMPVIKPEISVDVTLDPPVVVENVPYEKEKFHIYLFIGQSNMNGRATIPAEEYIVLDDVFLFNNEDKWEYAQPYPFGTKYKVYQGYNRYSSVDEGTKNELNSATSFSRVMTENLSDEIGIGIISNARGGTSIDQWQKGSGSNLYEEAVRRTKAAIEKGGVLKGICWLQGESCSSKAGYLDKLNTMVTGMRAEIGVEASDVPFIASQIIQTRPAGNAVIAQIAGTIENSDYISSVGTATIDNLHYDADSQKLLGIRYAQKMLDKVYGITKTETELKNSVYLTRPDDLPEYSASMKFEATAGEINTVTVINHNGENETINGNYVIIASRTSNVDSSKYTIEEYGLLVSTDENKTKVESCDVKVQSLVELTSSNAYGMLIYNLSENTTYYLIPYTIYKDTENNNWIVYGDTVTHSIAK